jgi:hypothetical protein
MAQEKLILFSSVILICFCCLHILSLRFVTRRRVSHREQAAVAAAAVATKKMLARNVPSTSKQTLFALFTHAGWLTLAFVQTRNKQRQTFSSSPRVIVEASLSRAPAIVTINLWLVSTRAKHTLPSRSN